MRVNNVQRWRFFPYVGCLFVAVLLIANTVGGKVVSVFGLNLPGGIVIFPISYIFGDVLTEVYGFRASRRIIWTGLFCNALMSFVYLAVQYLPAAPFWPHQTAYEEILGFVPRITMASICAYFSGEFCNSYVLAKMKIWTKGKYLWTRTIGSTVIGEGVDTIIFCLIAFSGKFPAPAIFSIIISNYVVKVLYEVLATPLTYRVVSFLKKAEEVDVYDYKTNFNPFVMESIFIDEPESKVSGRVENLS